MKEKKDCKIIQDLLPNYIENLTSVETNTFIKEHLKECNECQKVLKNMQMEFKSNTTKRDDREVNFIKKFGNKLKILRATLVLILAIALFVMTYYYFYMRDGYIKAAKQLVQMVSEDMYPDIFYATIEEIYDTEVYGLTSIKINGLSINDKNHREEYTFDIPIENIGDNFKIKFNGNNISLEDLKVGQKVVIYNYGDVDETNCLADVRMVVVLDEEL